MTDSAERTPESREMYTEIASLVGAIAKALAMPEGDIVAALERGTIALNFATDANGNRFVVATHGGQTARVYHGAIRRSPV